jgi:hypothetical protein
MIYLKDTISIYSLNKFIIVSEYPFMIILEVLNYISISRNRQDEAGI